MIPLLVALLLGQPAPTPEPQPTPQPTPEAQPAPQPAPEAQPAPQPTGEAQPTPAASPEDALGHGAAPLPADRVQVEVLTVAPNGRVAPAVAELRLERLRRGRPGDDSPPKLVGAWVTRSNEAGKAYFSGLPPLGMAESDRVVARYAGVETTEPVTAENDGRVRPVRLVVRAAARDTSALTLSMRVGLTPMDALFRVEHILRFDNNAQVAIDTDDADGLPLPLFVPTPFGAPVEGLLPGRPDPNELFFQMEPEVGRIAVERGNLVFRGFIPPEGLAIRIVMAMPYASETRHDLGLVAPVRIDRLSVVMQTPAHLAPTLSSSRPAEAFVRPSQGGEERTMSVVDGVPAGEVVTFTIDGTPDRHGLMRPLTAGLSLLVVAALVLLVLASNARKSAPRPNP